MADTTFFTHGSFNYRKDQIIKETKPCHKLFKDFIQTDVDSLVYIAKCNLPRSNERFYGYNETVSDVYRSIFGTKYVPNFPWACGKWIAVGRNRIRKTPLEVYKRMLRFVLKPHNGEEPS